MLAILCQSMHIGDTMGYRVPAHVYTVHSSTGIARVAIPVQVLEYVALLLEYVHVYTCTYSSMGMAAIGKIMPIVPE